MSSSRFKVLPVHKKIIEALDEEDALIIHPFEYNYKAIYQGLAMAIHSYLINDDSDEQPQILILDSSRTKLEHITQVFEQLIIEFKIVTLFNENDINQSFDLLCDYNDPPRIVISSPGTINNLIKYHTNCIDNFNKLIFLRFKNMLDHGHSKNVYDIWFNSHNSVDIFFLTDKTNIEMEDFFPAIYNKKLDEFTITKGDFCSVQNYYISAIADDKPNENLELIEDIFASTNKVPQILIICNNHKEVADLNRLFLEKNFNTSVCHSRMDLQLQLIQLQKFNSKDAKIIITDHLPEGLVEVNILFFFDFAIDAQDYNHARKVPGVELIISLIETSGEYQFKEELQETLEIKMDELPINFFENYFKKS